MLHEKKPQVTVNSHNQGKGIDLWDASSTVPLLLTFIEVKPS